MGECMSAISYDAILILSFGGPECREDVIPFLENVLRGKNVPRERMLAVAEHYYSFGGVSPINSQTRALIAALREELDSQDISLPIYWGNRNWHPLLADEVRRMASNGIRRVLAYVTSAYSSYSGCRQYLESIETARAEVGPNAPRIDKLRVFFNHPRFVDALASRAREALQKIPKSRVGRANVVYTAHSIPAAMSDTCDYVLQLEETARLVSQQLQLPDWHLAYQSRSGPPRQKWLDPDIRDVIRQICDGGKARDIVVVPFGFLSDHLEVLYDLDIEAQAVCDELGVNMVRAATVGTHPQMVRVIRELIEERISPVAQRQSIGQYGPRGDICPPDCCRFELRPPPRAS